MTQTITDIQEAIADLVDQPGVSDTDLRAALASISTQVADVAHALTAPMTHDQRRAMFALFTDVFGDSPKEARKVFTRLVLCRPADAPVSWADGGDRNGQGALTAREASKVLDALSALQTALH